MTTRTTAEERKALREMEAAATPGPWTVYGGANTEEPYSALFSVAELDKRLEQDDLSEDYEIGDEAQPDAALIAATRNALPALLADLEDALGEVARFTRCVICAGAGTLYENHGEGLVEPLACDGCEGTGQIDPPAVIQSLMGAWADEKKVAFRLRAETARLRRAIESYRATGKWAAGHIMDLLPPDAVPPDIMGMIYRADNLADPGLHPEGETAEVPRRTADLEAEVARQAAVIRRVRELAEMMGGSIDDLSDAILAALDETEASPHD